MRAARKYAPMIARGATKRYGVYAPAVKQLASDVMYLKGVINSEPHLHITQSSGNFDYSGTVISCCDIPLGDTDVSRTGNRVLPRYFSLHMQIRQDVTTTTKHATHRVIVFRYWGEVTSSASPNVTANEVLSTTGNTFAPLSHLNQRNVGPKGDRQRRIEILRNEQFSLDQVGVTFKDIVYNIEMNGKSKAQKEHMEWYGTATAQPISGGIYVLVINDNNVSTDQTYKFEAKITYYDN